MNLLDLILLAAAFLLGLFGYRKGLLVTLFSFVSTWLALFLAWTMHQPVTLWVMREWSYPLPGIWAPLTPWLYRLTILMGLFFGWQFLMRALARFLKLIHWIPVLSQVDRFFGAGLCISVLAFSLYLLHPFLGWLPSQEWQQQAADSYWLNFVKNIPFHL